MRRIWIALVLMGLLGGCQQPGDKAELQSANTEQDGRLRFFEPEFSALLDEVAQNLGQACSPSATDEDRLNRCIRDHFAEAFDDSRQGRQYCAFHTEVSDFIGCVALGNTFIDVRHRLQDESPVPASYWREEGAMIDALTRTIVKQGVDRCGTSGGKERIQACVMDWFEQRMDLPARLAERCQGQPVEKDHYGCLVEGVMLRYLQDHVARLGAMST